MFIGLHWIACQTAISQKEIIDSIRKFPTVWSCAIYSEDCINIDTQALTFVMQNFKIYYNYYSLEYYDQKWI